MSDTARVIPFISCDEWRNEGLRLGERERSARSLMWDIGDWWNRGEAYGERAQIVGAPDWDGPSLQNCYDAGSVARRWPLSSRLEELEWWHHQEVASLPDANAIPLLEWCRDTDPTPTKAQLRTRKKQVQRAAREEELAEAIEQASIGVGHQVYGVIYADPPWRFTPYSVEGMDRAADNHYPTMAMQAICELAVPAADDAVLFLWATVPMLPQAIEVMDAWGFAYRSHFVWVKHRAGTGYWNRNQHELLLVGVRGHIPAPAPGEQYASVIEAPLGEHSAKPAAFAEMIEEMYPHLPAIELFARAPRLGWAVWGAEASAA